jgi:hypothetical protein
MKTDEACAACECEVCIFKVVHVAAFRIDAIAGKCGLVHLSLSEKGKPVSEQLVNALII